MKKNGHKLLTWEEMIEVEARHPFFAGNLRSLRMGGLPTASPRSHRRVKHPKRTPPHTAKSRPQHTPAR